MCERYRGGKRRFSPSANAFALATTDLPVTRAVNEDDEDERRCDGKCNTRYAIHTLLHVSVRIGIGITGWKANERGTSTQETARGSRRFSPRRLHSRPKHTFSTRQVPLHNATVSRADTIDATDDGR